MSAQAPKKEPGATEARPNETTLEKSVLRGPTKRTSLMIVESLDEKVETYVKNEGILKSRFINEALLEKLQKLGAL